MGFSHSGGHASYVGAVLWAGDPVMDLRDG